MKRRKRALAITTLASLQRLRLTTYTGSQIRGRLRAALALGLGVFALTLSVGVPVAHAATFSVNSTVDAHDNDPGDGICLTDEGDCTLRAAVDEANALAGADTILVPAGTYTISIPGAGEDANLTGDFDILGDLTIIGAGEATTIIDGADLDRVFHVVSGTVWMSGLTIQNGLVAGFGPVGSGGGVFNQGTLIFTNITVSGNTSSGSFPGGGGIFNGGTLTLISSTVSNNNSAEYGGGIINNDFSTLTLTNSTVSGNTAAGGYGGGIANLNGTLTLNNSTVSGNSTGSHAGGILAGATTILNNSTVSGNSSGQSGGGILSFGTLTLTNSTVSGNQGGGDGGGGIRSQSGVLTITNSTVSGNRTSSPYGNGGGILNEGAGTSVSTAIITNSTISGNHVSGGFPGGGYGGGVANKGSGVLNLTSSTVSNNTADSAGGGISNRQEFPSGVTATLKNTIVADNSLGDCYVDPPASLASAGHNLSSDSTCGFTSPGDLQNTDPLLGPLADNGGPTETHALLPGSPAIDAGSNDCPPPPTDQRGVSRPQGAGCDIGAFEREVTPSCPPGDDDRDDDGLDDESENLFGNLLNDADSDDDGIRDGNDDGDDDGEDDEDEDDGNDPCPEDGDGDGEDDEDEDDEEDD